MTSPARILVLGASYGLLPGVKLSLAGHAVSFVARADEVALMARDPISVHLSSRRGSGDIVLTVPVADCPAPGKVGLATPTDTDPAMFDLVILAMQEPHFAEASVAALMARCAAAARPMLSLMNLPPPPYLSRLGIEPEAAGAGVYQSEAVWRDIDPARFTLASADPQAIRPDPAAPGRLQVTLASNFKAAPFALAADQALLRRLASNMSQLKVAVGGASVRPPVALLASSSRFAPLAKWPMLITGNCRCVLPQGSRTIAEAVQADAAASAALYEDVARLARKLGAAPEDLVAFHAYARAAARLTRPSSLARALEAGACQVERIDLLVRNLMRLHGLPTTLIDPVVDLIERRLLRNRALRSPG